MDRHRQIYVFLSETLLPDADLEFDPEKNLLEGGDVDSVAMMEMIVWLEETFNIQIDADDLTPENFATINAMVNYVEKASGVPEA